MAELGIAAGVIAVIQIVGQVTSLSRKYYTDVKDAHHDVERLTSELEAFKSTLESLHKVLAEGQLNQSLTSTQKLHDDIDRSSQELLDLKSLLEPKKHEALLFGRLSRRALKWPFQRGEVEKVIGRLERLKSSFTLALSVDQASLLISRELSEKFAKLTTAEEASFDSRRLEYEPLCLKDTREDLLAQVYAWTKDTHNQYIFWINGMAGTGKSTIMRTVAQHLAKENRLGASFFFSRGRGDVSNANMFFSTIAKQLAKVSPQLKKHIAAAVAENEDISQKFLAEQWRHLILGPIQKLDEEGGPFLDHVIAIDALDECSSEQDIRKLLDLLAQIDRLHRSRIRVVLSSRPETMIRLGFGDMSRILHYDLLLKDIPTTIVDQDVRRYVQHEFQVIAAKRKVNASWPSPGEIEVLVEKSEGLFIYAATVCRFVDDWRGLPQDRLRQLLNTGSTTLNPLKQLDQTYLQILQAAQQAEDLSGASKHYEKQLRDLLSVIITSLNPLSIKSISGLMNTNVEEVELLLDPLHSILAVPENRRTSVNLLHPSFRDFIYSYQRCTTAAFHVTEDQGHDYLARACLHVMIRKLTTPDICGLTDPGVQNTDISAATVQSNIPYEIQYACRYWTHHFLGRRWDDPHDEDQDADDLLETFLRTRLLFWLEIVSLLGIVTETISSLSNLRQKSDVRRQQTLAPLVNDALRLVLGFRHLIEKCPLQVYYSLITFCPETSLARVQYECPLRAKLKLHPRPPKEWGPCLMKLEHRLMKFEHNHIGAAALAFSPTGHILASGGKDGTICFWDPFSGELKSRLVGHQRAVTNICFSPDGQWLASGSDDRNVILWNATGELLLVLRGHLRAVKLVRFSPVDNLIASASWDDTVRLWTTTGNCLGALECHSSVSTISFSLDGSLLASTSDTGDVRVWSVTDLTVLHDLPSHSSDVHVTSFSDGFQLMSVASDKMARLGNARLGTQISRIEVTELISSVAFSSHNNLVAFGSTKATLEMWDIATGEMRYKLSCKRRGRVLPIRFSPDGSLIAWCIFSTILVCDSLNGDTKICWSHENTCLAIDFHPDGRFVASYSIDGIVMLNDVTQKGDWFAEDKEATPGVVAITFAPDRRLVASSSRTGYVYLWEVETGELVGTLSTHGAAVAWVVFSPDGKTLMTGPRKGGLKDIWNLSEWMCRGTMRVETGPSNLPRLQSSHLYYVPATDEDVQVWDTINGPLIDTGRRKIEPCQDQDIVSDGSCAKANSNWELVWSPARSEYFTRTKMLASNDGFDAEAKNPNLSRLDERVSSEKKQSVPDHGVVIGLDEQWLTIDGRRMMWLPSDVRPDQGVVAQEGGILVIGNGSGRVTFVFPHDGAEP